MIKRKRGVVAALAIATMAATQVHAGCWNETEAAAASVRELQSTLMVSALRCAAAGHTMTDDYNGFVIASMTGLTRANDGLKRHFIAVAGPVEGQRAYDAFTTARANAHGGEATSRDSCAAMAAIAREGAMLSGSVEGLALLAERQGLTFDMPGGLCTPAPAPIAGADPQPAPAPGLVLASVVTASR